MKSKRLTVPEQKNYEYAHKFAYQLAGEKLAQIKDIEQQCRKCDAQCRVVDTKKEIVVQYLNQPYLITLPDINVSLAAGAEEVPLRDKILILHYFTSAKGTPLANRLITFRELPEGSVYFPSFSKRTIKLLMGYFGQAPHLLVDAGEKLGASKADYGDAAITINAFSRVPVTIVIWGGDEEFAPQGSILFDAAISDYLSTEDITVLCGAITSQLIRYAKDV